MAYRSGTYVAFHADGIVDPSQSDMKYYRLLQAWHDHDGIDFSFVNSHDKASAVRDTSKRATLEASLRQRLNNSRNMLLVIGDTTRFDTDWVPFEIAYAADECRIPIIAAYTNFRCVTDPQALRDLWPPALSWRINDATAQVIHVGFAQLPIRTAVEKYDHDDLPGGQLVYYTQEAYRNWGLWA